MRPMFAAACVVVPVCAAVAQPLTRSPEQPPAPTGAFGNVPPGNRAYFSTHVAPAASYRVQVQSFDWGSRGGSSN